MSEPDYHKGLPFGKIKEENIDKDNDRDSMEYAEKEFKSGRLSWLGENFREKGEEHFELWVKYENCAERPMISRRWAKRILALTGNEWDYLG